jgi:hypothetical protein
MEHSPSWETKKSSGRQEIPYTLWNPKVHYHIHTSPAQFYTFSKLIRMQELSYMFLQLVPGDGQNM